jgi:hypothetical protein
MRVSIFSCWSPARQPCCARPACEIPHTADGMTGWVHGVCRVQNEACNRPAHASSTPLGATVAQVHWHGAAQAHRRHCRFGLRHATLADAHVCAAEVALVQAFDLRCQVVLLPVTQAGSNCAVQPLFLVLVPSLLVNQRLYATVLPRHSLPVHLHVAVAGPRHSGCAARLLPPVQLRSRRGEARLVRPLADGLGRWCCMRLAVVAAAALLPALVQVPKCEERG